MANLKDLINVTLTSVERGPGLSAKNGRGCHGNDAIILKTEDGRVFQLVHEQDCCESVTIEDIVGDLEDLVGSPLLRAEERAGETGQKEDYESYTWTFYEFATIKGSVTIRFYGTSNGYYSESVSFMEVIQ